MTKTIRVLMADDSAAVRRLVSDTLSQHPDIEVVGAAKHGQEALAMIPTAKPNVILLDVEMPVMDGIETLRKIRSHDRRTPILMFSSLTVKGGEATLEALSLGASDYVAKPAGAGHVQQAIDYLNQELIPKLLQWGQRFTASRATLTSPRLTPNSPPAVINLAKKMPGPIDVIAIGSSTGGPNALADVISKLPPDLSVPVLIAQHMPAVFTRLLAERLDRTSKLSVREAQDGVILQPGTVWVAPGDFHMTVQKCGINARLSLNQDTPENSCRPSVDVLFRSVAQVYGRKTLAAVLTGMGKDGTEGCRVLGQRGAFVIAQDEASCVVWGMPRAVTEAGLADKIVALNEMHIELATHARLGSRRRSAVVV